MKTQQSERSKKYSEKLRDPRWQKTRLQILERDEWACQICFDGENTLHVHHRYYVKGADPWEYPAEALITLCEPCHSNESETRYDEEQRLLLALRKHFFAAEIADLATGFETMEMRHMPEVVASALVRVLTNEEAQRDLIDAYFSNL